MYTTDSMYARTYVHCTYSTHNTSYSSPVGAYVPHTEHRYIAPVGHAGTL